MKKLWPLMLSLTLVLSACGKVKTESDVKGTPTPTAAVENEQTESEQTAAVKKTPDLNLLSMSSNEKVVNIVRDQLTKSGFNVTVNIQPDYASYVKIMDAGNYDVSVSGWTTVTGNPDYAVRSLFITGGDYNKGPVEDPSVDELIDKAASETPEQYLQTYSELEQYLVEEKAYIVPLYRNIKTQGINKEVLDPTSVRISQARSLPWEAVDFNDISKRATEPLLLSQPISTLTSLDPIKANDGSINIINTNQYVRLVNLTDNDQVIPDGSLSYNYVIADNNQDFYFILRDDVSFARVENHGVVSNERVGAEDVKFSMDRARDKDSVPLHKTYSLHGSMQNIEIITDLEVLKTVKAADGRTILEDMELRTPSTVLSLTDDKTQVDNNEGVYQVVKITTDKPFPQVLNYLAHQSAGIVSKKQVESINTFDVQAYDPNKDIAYGDQSTVTEGSTYNNTLCTSGPYILVKKNDYEAVFMKNPGYMPGTEYEPRIKTVIVKFIKDQDSELSALRAGETHLLYNVLESKIDLVTSDPKLILQEIPSNGVNYLSFNLTGAYADENLRKAVLYAVNQEEIKAVFNNRVENLYSTLSPLVDTGNSISADPEKVAEYLSK